MIDLSSVPFWIVPGVIVFLFTLGAGVNRFVSSHVSPKQLEERVNRCVASQNVHIKQIQKDISEIDENVGKLNNERAEIWDLVRKTEQRTEVVSNDTDWIKKTLERIEGKLK